MLDLNFVRENIDTVRAALANRNFPPDALNEFAVLDAERRRVIGESDAINQLRNASSKEIGALMQAGEREKAVGYWRQALRHAPDSPILLRNLAAAEGGENPGTP